jgi:HD-GYP domain-containing protein (c-di-GMP phosphodiesterase class II)
MTEASIERVGDLEWLDTPASRPSVEVALAAARDLLGLDIAVSSDRTDAPSARTPASVPLTSSTGRGHGTLSARRGDAIPELGERDLRFLRLLARLIADQIERDEIEAEERMREARHSSANALAKAVEARDSYTGAHSRAVVDLALAVAGELGLSSGQRAEVELVALLHDIGKLAVPDSILRKPGPLTAEEWQVMRRHPIDGARLAGSVRGVERLAEPIRAEHERWDGHGYPDGLAGESIPIASRITLVCDAFDAMTSERPYRPALSVDDALEEVRAGAGSQFCPRSAAALVAVAEPQSAVGAGST